MAVIGDDWRTVPAEPDERRMPPPRDRSYPPQHTVADEGGKLRDPLHHWDEAWVEW